MLWGLAKTPLLADFSYILHFKSTKIAKFAKFAKIAKIAKNAFEVMRFIVTKKSNL
jgi:hypothetical protein